MGFLDSFQKLAGTGSQISIEDVKKEWGGYSFKRRGNESRFQNFP